MGTTNHNNFVYGKGRECGGGVREDVCRITHDKEILDQFIKFADVMLAGQE